MIDRKVSDWHMKSLIIQMHDSLSKIMLAKDMPPGLADSIGNSAHIQAVTVSCFIKEMSIEDQFFKEVEETIPKHADLVRQMYKNAIYYEQGHLVAEMHSDVGDTSQANHILSSFYKH